MSHRSLRPIDESEVQRRSQRGVFTSPAMWGPVAAGVVLLALSGSWVGTLAYLGWACIAGGVGWAAWRFTVGRDAAERSAVEQLRRELSHGHREYLRDLRSDVRGDSDGRATQLLRTLSDCFDRLVQQGIFELRDAPGWHTDLRAKIVQLYESAVTWVERSIELNQAQQRVGSADAKARLKAEREALLAEIDKSTKHLTQTLDRLELDRLDRQIPEAQLAEARADLDRGLDVARRVDERLEELQREVSGRSRE